MEKTKGSVELEDFEEKEFLTFVQGQIDEIKKYTQIYDSQGLITLDVLNKSLSRWADINATLLGIYSLAKLDYRKYQEEFDQWFAEKYLAVRAVENPKTLSAQKWAGQKEIEMIVKTQFKEEYLKRKKILLLHERRTSFLKRMLDLWSSQQFVLSTLSRNLQAEVSGLSLSIDKIV